MRRYTHTLLITTKSLGDLIMTKINIQNLQHFLKELEKNITDMEDLFEQEIIRLQRIHTTHNAMHKLCKSWLNQLEHQK